MKPERTDQPVPPWELPGAVRRDCEPHRGLLLQRAARLVIALGAFGAVLFVPALLCFPLGAAVWRMARRDLTLMRLGLMDPAGAADTRSAQADAVVGVLVPFFGWGLLAMMSWLLVLVAGRGGGILAP
jgi:hypothetical protein